MPRKQRVIQLEPDGTKTLIEDGVAVPDPDFAEDAPTTAVETRVVSKTSAAAAVSMRLSGAPYTEIADVLEYASAAQARWVVEKQLAGAYDTADRESLFRITAARHERLLATIAPKALTDDVQGTNEYGEPIFDSDGKPVMVRNKEQIPYARLMLDVMARQAKLHGIDAPTQVQITPAAEEFNAVLALLKASQTAPTAPEADIWADTEDAVIVEDGEL